MADKLPSAGGSYVRDDTGALKKAQPAKPTKPAKPKPQKED